MAMQQSPDDPVYCEPISVFTRVFVLLAGLVPFLAPYELLIKPGVPVFRLGMIPFWVIAIGATCLGLLLIAAAVLGFNKTVCFDRKRRLLILRADGILGFKRIWAYDFAHLSMPVVRRDTSSEGPPDYRLEIPVSGRRRPMEIAVFKTETEAIAQMDRLKTILEP